MPDRNRDSHNSCDWTLMNIVQWAALHQINVFCPKCGRVPADHEDDRQGGGVQQSEKMWARCMCGYSPDRPISEAEAKSLRLIHVGSHHGLAVAPWPGPPLEETK